MARKRKQKRRKGQRKEKMRVKNKKVRDRLNTLQYYHPVPNLNFLASASMLLVGSEPMESRQTMGVKNKKVRDRLNTPYNYQPVPNLNFLASASMLLVGSDPMDSRQTMGVRLVLSSHIFSTSRMTPSAYLSPSVSAMYLLACERVRSGHQLRMSSRRRNTSSELL